MKRYEKEGFSILSPVRGVLGIFTGREDPYEWRAAAPSNARWRSPEATNRFVDRVPESRQPSRKLQFPWD